MTFDDESCFESMPNNKYRWYENDDFDIGTTESYQKSNVSTMVWGVIGLDFKPKLIFTRNVNKESY